MLGEGGWRSGLIWPIADANGRKHVDRGHEADDQGRRLDEEKGLRRFGERRSVGKAEAAIVAMCELLGTVGAILLADELRAFGRAQDGERTTRHVAAHQRRMGERLQEIERDRKQRHGQNRRAPALVGASADHGLF
jgi:hypothetical protein